MRKKIRVVLDEEDGIPSANHLFRNHNFMILNKAQTLAVEYIKIISKCIQEKNEFGSLYVTFTKDTNDDRNKVYQFLKRQNTQYSFEVIELCQDIIFAYFRRLGYAIYWRENSISFEDEIFLSWCIQPETI